MELEEFLYLSISVELLKYELSSSKIKKDTDYTLNINYLFEDNIAHIDLELMDGRKTLASTTIDSAIDSTFRKTISESVRSMMEDAEREETETEERAATIKDVIDLEESKPYVSSRGYMSQKNSFGIEASVAPGAQVYLWEFSDYVTWGLNARASLSFMWLRQKQVFGLSLTAWGGYGFNGDFTEGGPLYLSTVGGRFTWGLRTGAAQFIALYTEGGIAPLFLVKDSNVLIQTCPYFEAGVDFRVAKILNFFIDLSVGYKTIFEADLIISSIEPSVSISFEL